jgi:hypothetical protein
MLLQLNYVPLGAITGLEGKRCSNDWIDLWYINRFCRWCHVTDPRLIRTGAQITFLYSLSLNLTMLMIAAM